MPASKVAACKKAASKVERVQLFIATRWLIRVFASKLSNTVKLFAVIIQSSVLLKVINLSSVIYLRKIIQRSVNIFKSAKSMLDSNSISKYIILMFDEMYHRSKK